MHSRLEQVRQTLEEAVRPLLREHGGDLEIVSLKENMLTLRLRGQCAGCPSAMLVTRPQIEQMLRERHAWLGGVEFAPPVSDELLEQARQMLRINL